jgi:hypothetical protein
MHSLSQTLSRRRTAEEEWKEGVVTISNLRKEVQHLSNRLSEHVAGHDDSDAANDAKELFPDGRCPPTLLKGRVAL